MKQTATAFFFLLLFAFVLAAIFLSARTTIQFASGLDRPAAPPRPTPVAKSTPGALSKRQSGLPS